MIWLAKTALAAGLLGWLVTSGRLDLGRLVQLQPGAALAVLITVMPLSMFLTAVRWWYLLRIQRVPASLAAATRLTWIGYFAGMLLPGFSGGDVAKAYLIVRGREAGRLRAASTVLADRALGLYTFLIIGLASVAWMLAGSGASPALRGLFASLLMFFGAMSVAGALLASPLRPLLCRRLPRRLAEPLEESWDLYRSQPTAMAACLALSLICNAVMLVSFAAASAVLQLNISLPAAFQVGPLVVLANSLPLTPGGVGVGEATSHQLFASLGLAGGAEVMLLVRLVMLLASLPAVAMLGAKWGAGPGE